MVFLPTGLLLLICSLQTVVSLSHPTSVYLKTGGSVILEFHQQVEKESIDIIQWYFGSEKIMKYVPHKDTVTVFTHKDRVEFNKETFSLELKNLQKNDSGLYRGEISADKRDVKVSSKLIILDPVEAPALSIVFNVSCVNLSTVMVTCRGRDLYLNSTCNSSACSPERETSSDSNLTLSVTDDIITCVHRNQVSFTITTLDLNTQCIFSGTEFTHLQSAALHLGMSVWLSICVPMFLPLWLNLS